VIVVGLTGSIGMGKSTALAAFAGLGAPVWDADAAVHRLYGPGGAGVEPIHALAPNAVDPDGPDGVDRAALRAAILADPALLERIEAAIHPLVAADRDAFLASARAGGAALAVCDIPLLFETGADAWLDKVVVVSAPAEIQRARVLGRPGMTAETLDAILARQVPDRQKRARADYIVDTGGSKDHARAQVAAILAELTGG
jgi:dephospho-CoA kinase